MLSTKLLSDKSAHAVTRVVLVRTLASAAPQTKLQSSAEFRQLAAPAGLKCTRLNTGLFLATVDNHSPLSRVSLVFKAGTRYETSENRGVVHRLRNLIGLSTKDRTAIDFNYHVASVGAILTATATRDFFSFDVQIFRNNVVEAFRILDELMDGQLHATAHELSYSTPQMLRETNSLKDNWPAYISEKLHKTAFRRNGLANTLLSPSYAIGHHSPEQLKQFAREHFTTGNAVLAATGVSHDELMKWGSHNFPLARGSNAAAFTEKVKFYPGELRKMQPHRGLAHVQIGGQSVGLNDPKGTITYSLLANVLGTGPHMKWCDGQNRLAKSVRKATQNPFQVSASNIGYDGTGMFVLSYTSSWEDSRNVAKAVMDEFKSVASQGIKDQELQGAKNRLKLRLLSLAENDDYVVEDLGVQAAIRQSEACLSSEQVKLVDSVTVGDIQQAAQNIASGKLAMAAIGRLDKTPYLDELGS